MLSQLGSAVCFLCATRLGNGATSSCICHLRMRDLFSLFLSLSDAVTKVSLLELALSVFTSLKRSAVGSLTHQAEIIGEVWIAHSFWAPVLKLNSAL